MHSFLTALGSDRGHFSLSHNLQCLILPGYLLINDGFRSVDAEAHGPVAKAQGFLGESSALLPRRDL